MLKGALISEFRSTWHGAAKGDLLIRLFVNIVRSQSDHRSVRATDLVPEEKGSIGLYDSSEWSMEVRLTPQLRDAVLERLCKNPRGRYSVMNPDRGSPGRKRT